MSDPRRPIPGWPVGEPHEMVLHIAGNIYYPTIDGYRLLLAA